MKSQLNSQEMDDILDLLATKVHNLSPGDIGSTDRVLYPIAEAKAKLLELMLSCKPEPPEDFYRRHSLYRIGYQDAIDTMERNILKAFS